MATGSGTPHAGQPLVIDSMYLGLVFFVTMFLATLGPVDQVSSVDTRWVECLSSNQRVMEIKHDPNGIEM